MDRNRKKIGKPDKKLQKSCAETKLLPTDTPSSIRTRRSERIEKEKENQKPTAGRGKSSSTINSSVCLPSTSKSTAANRKIVKRKAAKKRSPEANEVKSILKKPAVSNITSHRVKPKPSTTTKGKQRLQTPKSDKNIDFVGCSEDSEHINDEIENVIPTDIISTDDRENSLNETKNTEDELMIANYSLFSADEDEAKTKIETDGGNEEDPIKENMETEVATKEVDGNKPPVENSSCSNHLSSDSFENIHEKSTETNEKSELLQSDDPNADRLNPVTGEGKKTCKPYENKKYEKQFSYIFNSEKYPSTSTSSENSNKNEPTDQSESGSSGWKSAATAKRPSKMFTYNSPPVLIRNSNSKMSGDKIMDVLIYKLGSHSTPRKTRNDKENNIKAKRNWGTPETNFFPFHNFSHNVIAKRSVSKWNIDRSKIKKIPSALINPINISSSDVIKLNKRITPKKTIENRLNTRDSDSLRKITQEIYEVTPVRSLVKKYEEIIKGSSVKEAARERVKIKIRRGSIAIKENDSPEKKSINKQLNFVNQKEPKQEQIHIFSKKTDDVLGVNNKRKCSFNEDTNNPQTPDFINCKPTKKICKAIKSDELHSGFNFEAVLKQHSCDSKTTDKTTVFSDEIEESGTENKSLNVRNKSPLRSLTYTIISSPNTNNLTLPQVSDDSGFSEAKSSSNEISYNSSAKLGETSTQLELSNSDSYRNTVSINSSSQIFSDISLKENISPIVCRKKNEFLLKDEDFPPLEPPAAQGEMSNDERCIDLDRTNNKASEEINLLPKSPDPGQFVSNDQDNDTPTASISMLFSVAESLLSPSVSYSDYRKQFYQRLSLQNTSPV